MAMHLDIITPEKVIYQGEVEEIVADTVDGQVGILPHHMNLFTKLKSGELLVKDRKDFDMFGVTEGFMDVNDNTVTILVDYAVQAKDIQLKEATERAKQAELILNKKNQKVNEQDYARARADLQRALMEIHVANRRQHRKIN